MGQVDLAAELLEQIGRPVPPVTSFKNYLGVLAGGGHRLLEREQVVVVDMADFESLAFGAAPDDHAPASVQVDADVLLGLHLGPPSSWSDWFGNPEFFTRLSMTRVDLVGFCTTLRRHAVPSYCSVCRPEYSPTRSHGSGQA